MKSFFSLLTIIILLFLAGCTSLQVTNIKECGFESDNSRIYFLPKTVIRVLELKKNYRILFPNVLRIQKEIEYYVKADFSKIKKINLSPTDNPVWVQQHGGHLPDP